jgi:PTH1 family peptidyl-tRNA hydrolase
MSIRCCVGLGNPGPRYEWTRHNAGFWVADRLATFARARWRSVGKAREAEGEIEGRPVVLLKPQTFMNASGDAVLGCLDRHRLTPGETLLIVDDVALPAGRLRLRPSGSDGGHRGLVSVIETLETREFPRLRVGVGGAAEDEDLADFVLRPLGEVERDFFAGVTARAVEAVRQILREGITKTMNRVNPVVPEENGSQAPLGPTDS